MDTFAINIHPIFVHFPVALLTLYGIAEVIRFPKLVRQPFWFYVKALMVIFGTLGAIAADLTGDMAKELARPDSRIVNLHENWAAATIAVSGVLAACYLVAWLNRENISGFFKPVWLTRLWILLTKISGWTLGTPAVVVLALAALLCITVTGTLGGSIAYGPNNDPATQLLYKYFIH